MKAKDKRDALARKIGKIPIPKMKKMTTHEAYRAMDKIKGHS